ncbi:MAG: hypothetical protein SOI38_01230 [Eggerthellaceae bacterium]
MSVISAGFSRKLGNPERSWPAAVVFDCDDDAELACLPLDFFDPHPASIDAPAMLAAAMPLNLSMSRRDSSLLIVSDLSFEIPISSLRANGAGRIGMARSMLSFMRAAVPIGGFRVPSASFTVSTQMGDCIDFSRQTGDYFRNPFK